jgi:hypothetical protein
MASQRHLLLLEDGGLEVERRPGGTDDRRRRDLHGHGATAAGGGREQAWGLRGGEGDGTGGGGDSGGFWGFAGDGEGGGGDGGRHFGCGAMQRLG